MDKVQNILLSVCVILWNCIRGRFHQNLTKGYVWISNCYWLGVISGNFYFKYFIFIFFNFLFTSNNMPKLFSVTTITTCRYLRDNRNIILLFICLNFSGFDWAFWLGPYKGEIMVHEALDGLRNLWVSSHFRTIQVVSRIHSFSWLPCDPHSMVKPCAWYPWRREKMLTHCLLKILPMVFYCIFNWKDFWVFYISKLLSHGLKLGTVDNVNQVQIWELMSRTMN